MTFVFYDVISCLPLTRLLRIVDKYELPDHDFLLSLWQNQERKRAFYERRNPIMYQLKGVERIAKDETHVLVYSLSCNKSV